MFFYHYFSSFYKPNSFLSSKAFIKQNFKQNTCGHVFTEAWKQQSKFYKGKLLNCTLFCFAGKLYIKIFLLDVSYVVFLDNLMSMFSFMWTCSSSSSSYVNVFVSNCRENNYPADVFEPGWYDTSYDYDTIGERYPKF